MLYGGEVKNLDRSQNGDTVMELMLLIHHDEKTWTDLTEESRAAIYQEYRAYVETLSKDGRFKAGGEFQGTSVAVTVRVRNGSTLKTNGPFADTREQLAGFFLIEAKDIEEAASIAAQIPSARDGAIEVRPVLP